MFQYVTKGGEAVANIFLKALRLSQNIKIKEMAEKIGSTPITYKRKENGEYPFDQNEIDIIINFFNMPYEKIFRENCHELKHNQQT